MVEKLNKDMIEAMKNKEKERLTVIRAVKASMEKERIDKKREVNDDLLLDVLNREVKMRKESIEEFKKGGRDDLVKQTEFELDILKEYLPEQLDIEEVKKIIDEIFDEVKPSGMQDMGSVMKEATSKLKGKADMKEISNIIRTKLQEL